ncbi:hypothetical protein PybrP1_010403 [[Pythium] brassicae (nom. inval.)]|nr:hypothetical protein PybrP1_010403 [[Pythium] brassicae (nom. inval.)]
MAGKGDIRSFFGGGDGPAKKKQKVADAGAKAATASATTTTAASDDTADNSTSDKEATTEAPAATTDGAVAAAEDDDAPIVHSFANLQRNAKKLVHASWYEHLEKEFQRASFTSLVKFLAREESSKKTIYPPPQDVFSALRDASFSSLKVVIIGQDPYHGPGQAHGLSFSVRKGVPPPPSLKNIFKEAMADVQISKPAHGCLSSWSQQGVLLLNAVLTVRKGEPNSHKKQGWEALTDAIIQRVNTHASHVVFLLWGKPAQEKGALVNARKHLVVRSSHPSPLGATKTSEPFIGSKCFSKANAYLLSHGKDPIDWSIV